MPEILWRFMAENDAGKVIRGQMLRETESDVLEQLLQEGMTPLSVSKATIKRDGQENNATLLPARIAARLFRSLADLSASGIELTDALQLLRSRERSRDTVAYLERLHREVRAGSSLSTAIAADRLSVQPYITSLLEAGETTGTLASQLALIADTLEAQEKMKRELITQIIYPASLFILIILTIVFLSYFVLPQFEGIFETADASPPIETRLVLEAGSWIRQFGAFVPPGLLMLLLAFLMLQKPYGEALSSLLLRLPLLGKQKRQLESIRYTRVLGAILSGGSTLSSALPVARRAVTSPTLQERYQLAGDAIRSGQSVSASLEQQQLASPETLRLIEIGERSGRLGEMLLKAADLCEADLVGFLRKLTAAAGPVLTALMGLVTAAVIAAVMSGVLSLNDAIYG